LAAFEQVDDDRDATTVRPAPASAEVQASPRGWPGTARYEVIRLLGEGGMGSVYEVLDRETQRSVALKTLRQASPGSIYRFKQEFRTLADLQHPNLVHLYEFVADDSGDVFFTMELIRGAHFLEYVRGAEGKVDYDRLRHASRQLVEGVLALHSAAKLHRDIKPSNVLVTAEGRVVVLDFGVAAELSTAAGHSTAQREIVGTAPYMAPEQALAAAPHQASDWYSVGVVLYAALTGSLPFVGKPDQLLAQKLAGRPPPPAQRARDVPADLDALCLSLLAPDPEQRPTGPEILRRLGGSHAGSNDVARLRAHAASALVGRDAHLRALEDALRATDAGGQVVMFVAGLSGMGKSALIRQFLDDQSLRGDAVVLRGRAYERESLPFKAVDAVVDALSMHLVRRANAGERFDLPADVRFVAKVFPVLRRVPGISSARDGAVLDPTGVRRRAFAALRELFASAAADRRLVLYVDDAQWGDVDSAALLLELLRPPALRLLLIAGYRENEAARSGFLREIRARMPERVAVRELAVGPLSLEHAERLAFELLGADERSRRVARSVAAESGGSPFLIEELACSMPCTNLDDAATEPIDFSAVTLEQMVNERSRQLPEAARRLLEVIAIEGRPVSLAIVAPAAGIAVERTDELVGLLRTQRFVRGGLREGREVVEMSHDRIRETVAVQLTVEVTREHHRRLAQVLEQTSDANLEMIAVHLLGAGETERGAKVAVAAAEEASVKLAFDNAAQLFRMAALTIPASAADGRRLRLRLAQVLEWAGRGTEAARVYEEAARFAPPNERTALERAAAEQLLTCGRIDEGAAVLRRVLADVGLGAPRNAVSAVAWLLLYRLWLRVRGLRFRSRAVAEAEQLRLDALFTVALGFGSVDVVLSACMTARSLVAALRAGDRGAVQRAATLQMSLVSAAGGVERRQALALEQTARRLVESDSNSEAQAFFRSNIGISHYCRGRWNAAIEELDSVLHDFPAHRAGITSNVNVFSVCSLVYAGRIRELGRRLPRLIADAEERGDLFMLAHLRASHPIVAWLAANDPDGARTHAREGMAQWPRLRFVIQHWQAMLAETQIALYEGDGAAAYERVSRDAAPLRRSLLLQAQIIRGLTDFVRGRAAVAAVGADPALREARLSDAMRCARRLRRERMDWTSTLSSMLEACVANARGDTAGAIASLRTSVELAGRAEMAMHGAAAARQLGALLGGEQGNAQTAEADAAMAAEEIRAPARWATMLLPGRFGLD
jgi:tetratricopeptide (TPR) repeat protein/predicted Ser/Thr protein kinase